MSIQFKGLADGADGNLYSASLNPLALDAVPAVYMFSESGEELDSLDGGDGGEHGVNVMEGCDKVCPMVPIVLPLLVIPCHDASIDAAPLSLE